MMLAAVIVLVDLYNQALCCIVCCLADPQSKKLVWPPRELANSGRAGDTSSPISVDYPSIHWNSNATIRERKLKLDHMKINLPFDETAQPET
jgi:hypothetical protein